MREWLDIPSNDSAAVAVADILLPYAQSAVQSRGSALLALAGGRTPADAYAALAGRALEWDRVCIVPTDERWVRLGHADCNETMLRRCFESAGVQQPRFLGLRGQAATLPEAVAEADAQLAAQALPFDLVVLGVGTDGHMASLFPGAAELAGAMAPAAAANVFAVHPTPAAPPPPVPRLTLGLRRLLWARQVVLLFGGQAKRRVVEAAICENDPLRWPVSALFHDSAPPVQCIHLEE